MRKDHRIIEAPLGAAIPRFPTDGIGVPGPAREKMEKERKKRKRKDEHVPYLRVTPL
jgi:hypothetical protein